MSAQVGKVTDSVVKWYRLIFIAYSRCFYSSLELYAVVTHTGFSLSSGHYVAYILAPPDSPEVLARISATGDDNINASSIDATGTTKTEIFNDKTDKKNEQNTDIPESVGIGNNSEADPNNNADTNNNLDTATVSPPRPPVLDHEAANMENNSVDASPFEDGKCWFECDDDVVTVLSQKEFEQRLSPSGSATPYMLFYRKVQLA